MRPLEPADRPELVAMLSDAHDFPEGMAHWYATPRPPHVDYVSWNPNYLDGVITGTFGADYRDNDAFAALDLPRSPHAFLTRIYVNRAARRRQVGLDLLEAFAMEAHQRRCTYIVGVLDLSSDPREREAFFDAAGFAITGDDVIGARVLRILKRIADLRR